MLAGGFGTRLRGVVPDLPKPMAPIGGRPFLEYQLDHWLTQGVTRFVLSLGYLPDAFIQHFGKSYRGAEIEYSIEKEPLGTGGGVLWSMEKLASEDVFLILNGDTLGDIDLEPMLRSHVANSAEMTLALVRVKAGDRYTCVSTNEEGRVLEFQTIPNSKNPLVNAGIYVANGPLIRTLGWQIGERFSMETEGFPRMLSRGNRLFGLEALKSFLDIGVPDDYYRANEFIHKLRQS